jgi:hypothetical protein
MEDTAASADKVSVNGIAAWAATNRGFGCKPSRELARTTSEIADRAKENHLSARDTEVTVRYTEQTPRGTDLTEMVGDRLDRGDC